MRGSRRRRRYGIWITAVVVVAVAGWVGYQAWYGRLSLIWNLSLARIEKVMLRCAGREVELADRRSVRTFERAVLSGTCDLPYPTRCLADDPDAWSVTFVRRGRSPFMVQVGFDDCGVFYCPSLGWTYRDGGRLKRLLEDFTGHEETERMSPR